MKNENSSGKNIVWQSGLVAEDDRRRMLGQAGCVVWFTGLSGSGKSTLAYRCEKKLIENGHTAFVLDGDNIRHGLNMDLGFTAADRGENIRRVAEVAALFADAGLITLTAFISPYRSDREAARQIIGSARFIEVFLDVPLSVCEQRDPKKLYEKARAGDIADFTGVSAPYEPPVEPDLRLDTAHADIDDCVLTVLEYVRKKAVSQWRRRNY